MSSVAVPLPSDLEATVANPVLAGPPGAKKRTELTEFQKGWIVGARAFGGSNKEIGRHLERNESTIRAFLKRYDERGKSENLTRSGRPLSIQSDTGDRILELIEGDRSITKLNLYTQAELDVHPRTLDRFLKKKGYRKWIAKKRPQLTEAHAAARLKWAEVRKDWTEEQWGHYIWSDECSVEKGKTGGVKWVFRIEGENPYQVGLADGTRTAKGVTLMVWGCFWGSTLGYLHPLLVGHNNSERYVEILEAYLPLVKEDMAAAGISTPVFMQDNSPIHNSYYSLGWLQDEGWKVADHPACSPDLNPIEHVWRYLKRILCQKFPDIATCRGGPATVKKRLADCLLEAWKEIPSTLLDSLTRSMPRRVAAVIKAEGWYTKY